MSSIFEVHATEPERAVRFYSEMFGWEFRKWAGPEDYWVIRTGPGDQPRIDGGLIRRRGPPPAEGQSVNAYVCTVEVATLDLLLVRLTALGRAVAVPKMAIPRLGWLAYAKDPDGNILGLMQPDEHPT